MLRLGILGGGQLAQMMTQAAVSLGVETAIFERHADSPASRLTHESFVGEWEDDTVLRQFADVCDVVTLENEFVDAGVLDKLASYGKAVYPTASTLRLIQDKWVQKRTMQAAGLPVPSYVAVENAAAAKAYGALQGYPFLLKARRNGYDGYGNATIRGADEIEPAWERLSAGGRELMAEAFIPFVRELAVMVLRGRNGDMRVYPVVETVQQNHICHVVRAPAMLPAETQALAKQIAVEAVRAVDGVGVFGVELFEVADGQVIYNEIAPRPHNSGHYTIEACLTSQFENHIRAVMGWALGETAMLAPCAVMVNSLGQFNGDLPHEAVAGALRVPGVHVHLYGKREVRVGRKMGHVTALGADPAETEARARQAADLINV